MSLYINIYDQQITELDDNLFQAWIEADNPKKDVWTLLPPKPSSSAIWNGNEWQEPPSVVPSIISARQIRLWLIDNGISLESVNIAIQNIPDNLTRNRVSVEWEYAPYIERNHPMLVPLANSLGLNESDVDRAFVEASQI